MVKNNDHVICFKRGGGGYTMLDIDGVIEARTHKRVLELQLCELGAFDWIKPVPVRRDRETVMRSDVGVFRKATETEYRAFFNLEPKQTNFLLTDDVRGKYTSTATHLTRPRLVHEIVQCNQKARSLN